MKLIIDTDARTLTKVDHSTETMNLYSPEAFGHLSETCSPWDGTRNTHTHFRGWVGRSSNFQKT